MARSTFGEKIWRLLDTYLGGNALARVRRDIDDKRDQIIAVKNAQLQHISRLQQTVDEIDTKIIGLKKKKARHEELCRGANEINLSRLRQLALELEELQINERALLKLANPEPLPLENSHDDLSSQNQV